MRIKGVLVLAAAALLAVPAFAGTAVFSGSANDTDAQLEGGWVVYQPQSLANPWFGTNPGGEADAGTTNLTTLCGARSLADLGTITLTLTEPNWDWADYWWGCWLEQQFSIGGEVKITVGIGSPYDWGDYGWIYVKFGTISTQWNQVEFGPINGNEPLGVRIISDGTNLSLQVTKDGTTFLPITGASWPINNLGDLGDISTQPLSLEIHEYGPCSAIDRFTWTAASVPDINFPADEDGDGLVDSVETDTGTFVGPGNTGTDPLLADTDSDGLDDGVETNSGTYVDENDTGSDPNASDSDGDGQSDGAEVAAGFNPVDPSSNGLPVAGLVGLGVLVGAAALGGALKLRKKS